MSVHKQVTCKDYPEGHAVFLYCRPEMTIVEAIDSPIKVGKHPGNAGEFQVVKAMRH